MGERTPRGDSDSLENRAAAIDLYGEFGREFKGDIDRFYLVYKTLSADVNTPGRGDLFWQRAPLFEDLAREYIE